MSQRLDVDELNAKLASNSVPWRILASSWRGVTQPCTVKCLAHGGTYQSPSSTLQNLHYGTRPVNKNTSTPGCQKCRANSYQCRGRGKTQTFEALAKRIDDVHGGKVKLLDSAVKRPVRSQANFQCTVCGCTWSAILDNVLHATAGTGCPDCARDLRRSSSPNVFDFELRGRVFTLDSGAEAHALQHMVEKKGVKVADFVVEGDAGYFTVDYHLPSDPKSRKLRKYYPDFFIPSLNRIVEVKSVATLGLTPSPYGEKLPRPAMFEMAVAKAKACLKLGYRFTLMLIEADGTRTQLPQRWYDYTLDELTDWYFDN